MSASAPAGHGFTGNFLVGEVDTDNPYMKTFKYRKSHKRNVGQMIWYGSKSDIYIKTPPAFTQELLNLGEVYIHLSTSEPAGTAPENRRKVWLRIDDQWKDITFESRTEKLVKDPTDKTRGLHVDSGGIYWLKV
ncbi:hypothetical protein DXG01_013817 [Tephrocybe rancida]|nr:hypothetical protein DXG01_013817 [Tephrocybe rancida]